MLTNSFDFVQTVIIFVVLLIAGLVTCNPMFMVAMPLSFTLAAIKSMVHKPTISFTFALLLFHFFPTFKSALHRRLLIATNPAVITFACMSVTQVICLETCSLVCETFKMQPILHYLMFRKCEAKVLQ